MYGVSTFEEAVAFIDGFDAACEWTFLLGFREWLVTKLGQGNNLAWSGLVRELAKRQTLSERDHDGMIRFLVETLERFFDERASRDGLRRIFADYERWMERRERRLNKVGVSRGRSRRRG